MHLVHLPQEQQDFKPWLQPFYGTVKHSIPAVYTGCIFNGNGVLSFFSHKTLDGLMVIQSR